MLCTRGFERLLQSMIVQNATKLSYCCSKRHYWNPSTHVFERSHPIQLTGKGKYPLVKKKAYIYKKLPPQYENYKNTMLCVLTKEIFRVGFEGQVVEVPKAQFRNHLYPAGDAVYASPDNIEKYEELRKGSRAYGIDYQSKMTMLNLSTYHINICMNMDADWILDKNHIRIAMRQLGILVDDENIILDGQELVTAPGPFKFWIHIEKILCTQMKGTVYARDDMPEEQEPIDIKDQHKLMDAILYYEDVFGTEPALSEISSDINEETISQNESISSDQDEKS